MIQARVIIVLHIALKILNITYPIACIAILYITTYESELQNLQTEKVIYLEVGTLLILYIKKIKCNYKVSRISTVIKFVQYNMLLW